jgi:hypothetical protein
VAEAAPALVPAGQEASLPDGVTRRAPPDGVASAGVAPVRAAALVRRPAAASGRAALAWAAAGTMTRARAIAVSPASQGLDPFIRLHAELVIMIT